MLYARPQNASVKIMIAPANAVQSGAAPSFFSSAVACHTHTPAAKVASGSSASHQWSGSHDDGANHLAYTVALTSGVARLTSTTPKATHARPQRVQASAFACSAPSVFITSHVAPSST